MVNWLSKNQGLCIAIVLNLGLLIWTYGCESTVPSLTSNKKVTRAVLGIEYNSEIRRLESELETLYATGVERYNDLDRQDALKAKLFDAVSIATQAGTFNPAGLLTLLGSITAVGLGVDNRIKDKVIKNRPLVTVTKLTDVDRG